MNQKTVVLVESLSSIESAWFERYQIFSSLKKACNYFGWTYNTMKQKGHAFIIEPNRFRVQRISVNK